jgi:hypothetical protein
LDEAAKLRDFKGHIITTQGRFLKMKKIELQKYEIILDEDILKTIFNDKGTINTYELAGLLRYRSSGTPAADKLIQAYEYTRQAGNKDILFRLPKVEITVKEADMSWGFDISAFCEAECFAYDSKNSNIAFIKPSKLHDLNLKCTVLSATADETIYKYYFGKENVYFHECRQAMYTGELTQYYDSTMSRSYIKEHLSIYSVIERELGKMPRITFQDFAGSDPIYYGKTEGCDFYKGQNICIIGTPHYPQWVYKLIAATVGIEHDSEDELRPQEVTHNSYRFRLMTYKDEVLRAVQFYLIEGELEQAVGRARLLRFDCVVYLFSNFPLPQARFELFGMVE